LTGTDHRSDHGRAKVLELSFKGATNSYFGGKTSASLHIVPFLDRNTATSSLLVSSIRAIIDQTA
jgi:hypothetical protein